MSSSKMYCCYTSHVTNKKMSSAHLQLEENVFRMFHHHEYEFGAHMTDVTATCKQDTANQLNTVH